MLLFDVMLTPKTSGHIIVPKDWISKKVGVSLNDDTEPPIKIRNRFQTFLRGSAKDILKKE
jgi:hypothetical protein